MNRVRRGSKVGARKAALVGAAAATAVAMTMGSVATPVAPTANAALTLDTTTTGPLLWLVNQLGVDSYTFDNVPVVGSITLAFDYNRADPVGLYNDLNAATFTTFNPLNYYFSRPNVLASSPTGPLMVVSGTAVPAALQTYQALLASANGNTPAGFTPLVARGKVNISGQACTSGLTCSQGTNVTNLPIALVRNPETPNGGLYARFAPIFNLFGMNPVSPTAGSGSSVGIRLNGAFVNVALGYDMLSDFPETLNPFSLANSFLASALPTYLLGGGVGLAGTDLPTIEGNLIALLTLGAPSTTYSTIVANDLPLLEPLRLPSRILNAVFKQAGIPITLGTPLADALQPALKILVNIGYTDVQTPSEGGTYNRTYDQSGQFVPFLSQATLTPQEWAAVPGDVVKALFTGFRDVLTGKSTTTPDPVTEPEDPPVDPPASASSGAQTVSTTTATAASTPASSAKSGKPSKKPSSAASGHKSAQKSSAHRGAASKRAAS
ncbi:PE-PPE domain-containing protein [Mycobacterium sp. RTGN5]|uniref:PE-PPE domain-containing protein n=1 Tax=Mycobacterium sp. RTGN5 TaxID=3016522 RepID=UPI0029C98279|nr:PE-PPE domain-containing protein [Mycobacterium sp. RTGN5]